MRKHKPFFTEWMEDDENRFLQSETALLMDASFLIEKRVEDAGLSRSEFAKLVGKSKSWVTQLLDGERNMNLKTLARSLAVLGLGVKLETYALADHQGMSPTLQYLLGEDARDSADDKAIAFTIPYVSEQLRPVCADTEDELDGSLAA